MPPHHHIFKRGHVGKQADVLKGAGNPRCGHFVDRAGLIGLPRQLEAATVGCVQARDDVEERGFASPIGTNQPIHLPGLNRHAHIAQGLQSTETFGNALDLQHRGAHAASLVGKALP